MVQIVFAQLLILLPATLVAAVQPLGSMPLPMALVRRQDLCVGPVICEQTATNCLSCEAGFYCTSDGGCCEVGQVCSGFKPCVNAGTPAPTETNVCPTEAPLCTESAGTPICSGSIEDWITISRALNEASTATEPPTVSTSPPKSTMTTTMGESSMPMPTTSTTEYPTYVPPPSETTVPTYAPVPSNTITYTPPAVNTTTATPPPVATGSGAKIQLQLGTITGLVLFTLFLL